MVISTGKDIQTRVMQDGRNNTAGNAVLDFVIDIVPYLGTGKYIQQVLTGYNYVTETDLSTRDRVVEGIGGATSLIPIPGAKQVGKQVGGKIVDGAVWVWQRMGDGVSFIKSKLPSKGKGNIPNWKGSGPAPGVLGVNANSKSVAAIKNYNPKNGGIEFVFDPKTKTFVVGSPQGYAFKGSPHQKLAQTIDADGKTVVGGTFSRRADGKIYTTENSGHYGQNWTPEVRKLFEDTMKSYKVPVNHTVWGK